MKTKYKIPAKIYSLDINSEKLVELNENGKFFFNQALEVLNTSITENKALLVYRGENKENLKNKLRFTNLDDLFYKLFHVGDKSKYFIKSNYFEQRYIKDINDVSKKVFEVIFDKINEKQNDRNEESEFNKYFTNIKNKKDFLEKIICLDDKSKLRIRDYYFSYLHQEETDKNNSSFFVSTSKDIEVAEELTQEGENKFIIYYFISKPYIDRAIYSRSDPYLKKYCQKNNLPIYYAPYYEEDEICVKVALAPHNILGITTYIDNEETFVVNPYLFVYNKTDLKKFVSKGLNIDRKKFDKIIRMTNYFGVNHYPENNRFEEIKENI